MNKKLMAANWKMYKTREDAAKTAKGMVHSIGMLPENREVLIFPPFTSLSSVHSSLVGKRFFSLGGQNFYPEKEGAFTGEISPLMLLECGCTYGLVGHSERRHVLGENDELISRKVSFGLEQGLKIVFCIGETLDERKAGLLEEVLARQIEQGLAQVERELEPERAGLGHRHRGGGRDRRHRRGPRPGPRTARSPLYSGRIRAHSLWRKRQARQQRRNHLP